MFAVSPLAEILVSIMCIICFICLGKMLFEMPNRLSRNFSASRRHF
jgi:hypothetical protein